MEDAMAVVTFTTWANTTEQTVLAATCRVTAIEIQPHASQAAEVYFQLFNDASPTPGSTAPNMVIPIGTVTTQGLKRRLKVLFPNGGIRFDTACTAFCGTAAAGGTAPTTTSLPPYIRVSYAIGN
jgi:hypothetical protein